MFDLLLLLVFKMKEFDKKLIICYYNVKKKE